MGRAERNRYGEVRAHAHRQLRDPVTPSDFRGEREMRRGRIVHRRNAHQARDRQAMGVAATDCAAMRRNARTRLRLAGDLR